MGSPFQGADGFVLAGQQEPLARNSKKFSGRLLTRQEVAARFTTVFHQKTYDRDRTTAHRQPGRGLTFPVERLCCMHSLGQKGILCRYKPRNDYSIMLAILHGSQATGESHKTSDWDVAVLGDHIFNWDERAALRKSLATMLNVPNESVDIADLRSDSPLLRYRAAMYGRLIKGDALDFRRFQIRAWKDYLNNEKIFDLRTHFLTNKLK
jgi:predicted nucleotidyltransferase